MKMKWNNIVMDAATDANGGGGGSAGGANSLLTTPASGGTVPTNSSNADSVQGAGANSTTTTTNNGGDSKGAAASDWKLSLPPELQKDATLAKFTSVHALAGSYLNAQKLIGAEKIPVPTKNSSDEDWRNVFTKLGLPEDPSKYEVKFKDGVSIDDKFATQFKDTAYKLGILPKQAQELANWFSDVNKGAEENIAAEQAKVFEKTVSELRAEWGKAFDLNIARANKIIAESGGPEMADHFNKLGLGADAKVMKFLAKIGENLYKEDKVVGANGGAGAALTPQQLKANIATLMADPAYFNKDHVKHKAIVDEVRQLHEDLYNNKN